MPPRCWFDNRLVESNPKLDIYALQVAGSLHAGKISSWACAGLAITVEAFADWIMIDGEQRVALQRDECINGKFSRTKFLCGCGCGRGCRMLLARAGTWACRRCCGYDWQCRHKNRWAPSVGRLQSLRRRIELGHPLHKWSKRKLREAMLAHEGNIADSVHDFVEKLRQRDGQRQRRSRAADAASESGRSAATLSRRRSSAR